MESFLTFNIQGILQTVVLIGSIVYAFGSTTTRLNTLDKKVDKLEGVMVQLARQDERLSAMDQRILAQGKRVDRLDYARRTPPQDQIEIH